MIALALFLFGGIVGFACWLYMDCFIPQLQQKIYQNYVELFPKNPPHFYAESTSLQPKKCGHFVMYFVIFGGIGVTLYGLTQDSLFSGWLLVVFALLWAISLLDWHYQLISPTPCLWLCAFGLMGAEMEWKRLAFHGDLTNSLESAVIFFLVFYSIYHVAKWVYKKEAFGQGDYWLAFGLGAYLPLNTLPQFLLISSLLGIAFSLIWRKNPLPFAPCLCLGMAVMVFCL